MRKFPRLALACSLIALTSIGCVNPVQSENTQISSSESNNFQNLLDVSIEELQLKTEAHQAWGLGQFASWNLDQDVGDLIFSKPDGTKAVAPAQIIGTFNTQDNSWLWAWDNPSIVDGLTVLSRKLRDYGATNGIEKLTTNKWDGTEEDAWEMVALAAKLYDAQGAYRGPAGSTYVFMTFGEVTLSKTP